MSQLALMLLRQAKWAEAEPVLREVVVVQGKLASESWAAANAKSMLGDALLGQRKFAEAEPLLVEGYAGLKRHEREIPPQGEFLFTEALERLVRHYEATGDGESVAKYKQLLKARATPKQPEQ